MAAQARAALRAGTVSLLTAGHSGPQPGGLWLGSVVLACSADGSSRLTRCRISNRMLLSSLPEKRAKNSFINMIGSLPKKCLLGLVGTPGGEAGAHAPAHGGGGGERPGVAGTRGGEAPTGGWRERHGMAGPRGEDARTGWTWGANPQGGSRPAVEA